MRASACQVGWKNGNGDHRFRFREVLIADAMTLEHRQRCIDCGIRCLVTTRVIVTEKNPEEIG